MPCNDEVYKQRSRGNIRLSALSTRMHEDLHSQRHASECVDARLMSTNTFEDTSSTGDSSNKAE